MRMSDLATLPRNEAFSLPSSPSHASKRSPPLSGERKQRKHSTSSTSSSSSSASPSPRHGRSIRLPLTLPQPLLSAPTPDVSADGALLSCEPSPDEAQWLLHSSRAVRLYSAQSTQPPSPVYPSLIEADLIVDDSRDDDCPASSSPLPLPTQPLSLDLLSSYEQLSFIRYPPDLLSIRLTRYAYAAIGLAHSPWPLKADGGERESVRAGQLALWLWQSACTALYVGGLVWLTWAQWTESTASESPLFRQVSAVCGLVAFTAALLLSHALLAHRLLTTRVFYLYRNSPTPALVVWDVDGALYGGLVAFAVLSWLGVQLDTWRLSFALPTPSPLGSLLLHARIALCVLCALVLRLQFVGAVSLFTSVLGIHRLRVEQAVAAVQSPQCDYDALVAQTLDVDLAVHDLSHRTGWQVAALLTALVVDGGVRSGELLWTAGAELQDSGVVWTVAAFDVSLLLFVALGIARLNASSTQLQAAVQSFPLLRAVAGGDTGAAAGRSLVCPDLSFDVVAFRVTFSACVGYGLLASLLLLYALTRAG